MFLCELCNKEHDGTYGSGRFCCAKCARSFSTHNKREEINKKVLNSNKVYYQSYSSDIANKKTFLMILPRKISKYCENETTDGIVSISSSVWGDYKGNMDKDYDHAEMVGAYGNKKTLKSVSKFYLNIVKELQEKGF